MVSVAEPPSGVSPLKRGSRIGKYTVLRLLATGGFAEVYLVQSRGPEGFAKLLVAKRLLPQLANQPDFVELFLDEARLAARFRHPNLAQVYDFGRSEAGHFLAMEYIEGESLANVIRAAAQKGRGMSLVNSLRVVQSLAAGLHYAHELRDRDGSSLSIVHRDVSPQNVMLTFDGNIKLLDFGIASARSSRAVPTPQVVRGSLRTMSPEQCAGKPLDRQSDVFSLGVLLFELTTGTLLHRETDESSIRAQILDGPWPLPSTRRPNYPRELERIVMKALERDRGRRYSTAEALQLELEAFARVEGHVASNIGLSEFMREILGEPPATGDELEPELEAEASEERVTTGLGAGSKTRLRGYGPRLAIIAALVVAVTLLLLGRVWRSQREGSIVETGPSRSAPTPRAELPYPSRATAPLAGSPVVRAHDAGLPLASVAVAAPPPPSTARHRASRPPVSRAGPREPIPAHSRPGPLAQPSASWTLDSPLPP